MNLGVQKFITEKQKNRTKIIAEISVYLYILQRQCNSDYKLIVLPPWRNKRMIHQNLPLTYTATRNLVPSDSRSFYEILELLNHFLIGENLALRRKKGSALDDGRPDSALLVIEMEFRHIQELVQESV